MKDLMMHYGVTLGRRFTRRQKAYFIRGLENAYPVLGFPVKTHQIGSGFGEICNITAGDPEKADIVFAAAFDTPAKSLLPNAKFYPLHAEKNLKDQRLSLILRILVLVVCAVAIFFTLKLFFVTGGFIKGLFLLLSLAIAGGALIFGTERANRFNFNRNSASLAVMQKVAESCMGNTKIAFAFLDSSIASYAGLKVFQEQLSNRDKMIVLMDSLSYGSMLLLAHRESMNDCASKLIELAGQSGIQLTDRVHKEEKAGKNILSLGKNMLYLVSGSIQGKEFVVENVSSKKDIQVDIERLKGIAQALTRFAKQTTEENKKK